MNSFIDFEELLNVTIEAKMCEADKKMKPILAVLKKYGIRGTKALTFLTEIAAVIEELKAKGL